VAKEPPEQSFVTREQFRQRVQEQTLAKAARAGEEIGFAFPDHAQGESGFIDVIAVIFPDFAEGLDADGQLLAGHGKFAGGTEMPELYPRTRAALLGFFLLDMWLDDIRKAYVRKVCKEFKRRAVARIVRKHYISPSMNATPPHNPGETANPVPPPSLLGCGIGSRLAIAAAASGLLWLAIVWALD
jgi:hypothetical protein